MAIEYETNVPLDDTQASELIEKLADNEQWTVVKREPRRLTFVIGPMSAANAKQHVVVKVRDDGTVYLSFLGELAEGEKPTQFSVLTVLRDLGVTGSRFSQI